MARILVWTSPARGHLFPVLPVADELHARGHEVQVRTLADEVGMVRARGLTAQAIPAEVEAIALDDWRARTTPGALAASVKAFGARAPFDAAAATEAIAQWRPDVVIADINAWGAMAAAERWGGPWATFAPYPLVLASPDVPPFGPGWAPARTTAQRLRDRVMRPVITGGMERTMRPPLNAVRRSVGLAPLASIDDLVLRAPLVISMTAEPFEYPRAHWPSSVVMVGPCAFEPPLSAAGGEAPDDVLDAVRDRGRPVVLVTTSSEFQDDGRLVDAALEALADEDVTVVATVPSGDRDVRAVPANAVVVRYAPHSALLPHAVVAVTHGGLGATQKSLAHGVPVVAVPFGRDQFEVARRVEVAGAGVRLPARQLRPDRLGDAIARARTMTAGARRVAAGFTAAGGAGAAADAVDARLVAASVPPPG